MSVSIRGFQNWVGNFVVFIICVTAILSYAQDSPGPVSLPLRLNQTRGYILWKLIEDNVLTMARELGKVYPTSCSNWEGCDICSQSECLPLSGETYCSNVHHNKRCLQHFPKCSTVSLRVTLERSSVAYPRARPGEGPDEAQQRSICGTTALDQTLKKLFMEKEYHAEYYVGFPDGSRRSFPGREEGDNATLSCWEYDCRLRPWYNAAITYSNHLVILMDSKESQQADTSYLYYGDTFTLAKQYAAKLLGTVYENDVVNIVSFGDEARALQNPSVKVKFNWSNPQEHEELDSLKNELRNLKAVELSMNRGSNLTAGLVEAIALMDAAPFSRTRNIVVFTDGDVINDEQLGSTLDLLREKKIRLFFFRLKNTNSGDKSQELDGLAQRAAGINKLLSGIGDKLFQMRAYSAHLATLQALSNRTIPIWTPPYQDYYDIGEIVTVVAPAFSPTTGRFVGVAAIDVLYGEMEDLVDSFKCALQSRPKNEGSYDDLFDNVSVYDDSIAVSEACNSNTRKPFCASNVTIPESQNFLDRMCCGKCESGDSSKSNMTLIIALSIGAGVFGAVVVCLLIHCRWMKQNTLSRQVSDSSQPTSSDMFIKSGTEDQKDFTPDKLQLRTAQFCSEKVVSPERI